MEAKESEGFVRAHFVFGYVLSGIFGIVGTAPAAQYSVTPLPFGVSAGATEFGLDVNSSGDVSGAYQDYSLNPAPVVGAVSAPSSNGRVITDLDGPPTNSNQQSTSQAINSLGQVVGSRTYSAILWTPTSNGYVATVLGDPNPSGSETIYATGINDRGQVIGGGWDFYNGGGYRQFIWSPTSPNATTGSMVAIGGGGGTGNLPNAINSYGEVLVTTQIWKPTAPNGSSGNFYSISGLSGGNGTFHGNQMNDNGSVVGASSVTGNTGHAFLWSPTVANGTTGSAIDLGVLASDPKNESEAFDINNEGVIVGQSGATYNSSVTDAGEAVMWSAGSHQIVDLNTLLDSSGSGWILHSAIAITDNGLILAYGDYDPDGSGATPTQYDRPVLLSLVPEPAFGTMIAFVVSILMRFRVSKRDLISV